MYIHSHNIRQLNVKAIINLRFLKTMINRCILKIVLFQYYTFFGAFCFYIISINGYFEEKKLF